MCTNLMQTLLGVGLAFALGAAGAQAGALNPPTSVMSTMKTLAEVEPRIPVGPLTTPGDADSVYRIAKAGSYFLTENLVGRAGFHGIEIASSNVTLDLMGFTVRGDAGSLSGVFASNDIEGVRVRNGVIDEWAQHGVHMANADTSAISDCTALRNGLSGIRIGHQSVVRDCIARENGVNGIETGSRATVTGCATDANGNDGLTVSTASAVVDCSALQNDAAGIRSAQGVTMERCRVMNNAVGVMAGAANVITDSTALFNNGDGVTAGAGSVIRNNASYANTGDGFEVSDFCLVIANNAYANGLSTGGDGAGIFAEGERNRIEGNSVTSNRRGLDVDGARNFILANTASDNLTNYTIVANNNVGVIVQAPASAAISGATGGAGMGTTDPWANFSH